MEHPKHRALLPRPSGLPPGGSSDERERESELPTPASGRGKRPFTTVACEACRKFKTKCSRKRPRCQACERKNIECIYLVGPGMTDQAALVNEIRRLRSELQAKGAAIQGDAGQHLDDATAVSAGSGRTDDPWREQVGDRRRPSSRQDLDRPVASFPPARDLDTYRISWQKAAAASLPPLQSYAELELTLKHPVAYPALDPSDASVFVDKIWPSIIEIHTHGTPTATNHGIPTATTSAASGQRLPANPVKGPAATQEVSEPGPEPPSSYCDPRVAYIDIGYWTTIPIPDSEAAKILSLYLETDHACMGFFDADLFLEDMVAKRTTFCSSLLVCSLFAWACLAYSAFNPAASGWAIEFYTQADKLWRVEKRWPSLPTIAALCFLSNACTCLSKNELAAQYQVAARDMGIEMKLFGVDESKSALPSASTSTEMVRAMAHTAWGAFNHQAHMALSKYRPGVEIPPAFSIPGDTQEIPVAMHSGWVFNAFCHFWRITSEVTVMFYSDPAKAVSDQVPLAFAVQRYYRLLDCVGRLPASMTRGTEPPAYVVLFHIWLHALVLSIFRPFVEHRRSGPKPGASSSNMPGNISAASLRQLKRLALQYGASFASSKYCLWWNAAIVFVANAVLADTNNPDWKAYFLFCISALRDLNICAPLMEDIAHGLLAMAVRNGSITISELTSLLGQVRLRGKHRQPREQEADALPVDYNLAIVKRNEANIDKLVQLVRDAEVLAEFAQQSKVESHGAANAAR